MKTAAIGGAFLGILLFGGILLGVLCLERVPVGYEGVVYSINGVKDETLTQGWHFIAPCKEAKINHDLLKYQCSKIKGNHNPNFYCGHAIKKSTI